LFCGIVHWVVGVTDDGVVDGAVVVVVATVLGEPPVDPVDVDGELEQAARPRAKATDARPIKAERAFTLLLLGLFCCDRYSMPRPRSNRSCRTTSDTAILFNGPRF
jgi:hypothetical protein